MAQGMVYSALPDRSASSRRADVAGSQPPAADPADPARAAVGAAPEVTPRSAGSCPAQEPGRCCSPRHRMSFNSIHERSRCVK